LVFHIIVWVWVAATPFTKSVIDGHRRPKILRVVSIPGTGRSTLEDLLERLLEKGKMLVEVSSLVFLLKTFCWLFMNGRWKLEK
jgi:hypothetical protein